MVQTLVNNLIPRGFEKCTKCCTMGSVRSARRCLWHSGTPLLLVVPASISHCVPQCVSVLFCVLLAYWLYFSACHIVSLGVFTCSFQVLCSVLLSTLLCVLLRVLLFFTVFLLELCYWLYPGSICHDLSSPHRNRWHPVTCHCFFLLDDSLIIFLISTIARNITIITHIAPLLDSPIPYSPQPLRAITALHHPLPLDGRPR